MRGSSEPDFYATEAATEVISWVFTGIAMLMGQFAALTTLFLVTGFPRALRNVSPISQ